MNLARSSLRKTRIEMVPLIDSFFLLLAFFISSMLSMSVIGGLPVELPTSTNAAKFESRDLRVVTIARNEQLQLDGEPVTLDDLPARLKADPHVSTLRIAVRTDRLVPAEQLLKVLGMIRGAGVHRVGLVTATTRETAPAR